MERTHITALSFGLLLLCGLGFALVKLAGLVQSLQVG